jgi:PPOX class probable F420-dependent enzyme
MTLGMATLSDLADLLSKPNHAVLATINADGSIHSTIIWVDVEGDNLTFNSARGRVWPTNLERDPRATVTLLNQENPYEYATITGTTTVVDDGEEARKQMDVLAKKYIGQDTYPWHAEGDVRVKFHLAPAKVRFVKA